MEKICIQKLPQYYWLLVIETAVVIAISHFAFVPQMHSEPVTGVANQAISTIAILVMLIGLPVVMKFYHVHTTEKIPAGKDEKTLERHLCKLFLLRFLVVLIALILNYIAYDIFNSSTSIYCVFICMIALFFFCMPNKEDLKSKLSNMVKASNPCE